MFKIRQIAIFILFVAEIAFAQLTVPTGGSFTITGPGSSLACSKLEISGQLKLESTEFNKIESLFISQEGKIESDNSIIKLTGNWINSGKFIAGNGTVIINNDCGFSTSIISGNTNFNNLIIEGGGREIVINSGSILNIDGIFRINGAQDNPIKIRSSSSLPAFINIKSKNQLIANYASFDNSIIVNELHTAIPIFNYWMFIILMTIVVIGGSWHFKKAQIK